MVWKQFIPYTNAYLVFEFPANVLLTFPLLVSWVEDGCPRLGKKVNGNYQPNSHGHCVRCCSNDGRECITPLDCAYTHNLISYYDSVSKCKEYEKRLCQKEELLNDVCCGTGGGGDSIAVWTLMLEGKVTCANENYFVRLQEDV